MTGIDVTAPRRPAPMRPRLRLPGTRQGTAWLAVMVIVALLLAFQFGRQVFLNWETGQRAAAIQAEIDAVEAENAGLRAELDYVRSEAFVGTEARRLMDLGAPGEQVLIIPPGAEEPLPADLAGSGEAPPLLDQWLDLFFGAGGD